MMVRPAVAVALAVAKGAIAWTAPILVLLARWGYAGVALVIFLESAGLPVPGETALLAAGFGAAHGVLALPWIIAVATVASVLGDNLGFALGRRLGRGWLERHGRRLLLTPERLRRVDVFFDRFGPAAVALARFVAGVRVVAAFAAGTSQMPWRVFLRFNVLGAVVWATLVSLAGYSLGRGYAGIANIMGRAGVVMVVVVPAALLAAWMLSWFRQRIVAQLASADAVSASATLDRTVTTRQSSRLGSSILVDVRALVPHIAVRWLAVLGVSAAGVLTFAAIAEEMAERDTAPFDSAVRAFALAHQSPAADAVFNVLSWAGSSLLLGPLAAVGALWLWRSAGRGAAAATVLAPVLTVLLIHLLKAAFHRARPEAATQFAQLGYSFPSGHSTGSMAISVTLAYVLARQRVAPQWSIAAAMGFSVLVGMSRLYLDVHWGTDVIGGWAVGLAIASASAALYEWLRASRTGSPGRPGTAARLSQL